MAPVPIIYDNIDFSFRKVYNRSQIAQNRSGFGCGPDLRSVYVGQDLQTYFFEEQTEGKELLKHRSRGKLNGSSANNL